MGTARHRGRGGGGNTLCEVPPSDDQAPLRPRPLDAHVPFFPLRGRRQTLAARQTGFHGVGLGNQFMPPPRAPVRLLVCRSVPTRLKKSEREERRRRALELLARGTSVRAVAREVGANERTVRRWKARPRPRPPKTRRAGRPRTWTWETLTQFNQKLMLLPAEEWTSERLFAALALATGHDRSGPAASKLLRLLGLRLRRRSSVSSVGPAGPALWYRAYRVALGSTEAMARRRPSARTRLPLGGL